MASFKIVQCQDCGSEFMVQKWEEKAGRRFCSRECYNAFQNNRNLVRHEIDGRMGGQDR